MLSHTGIILGLTHTIIFQHFCLRLPFPNQEEHQDSTAFTTDPFISRSPSRKQEKHQPTTDVSMTYMPTYYEILDLPEALQNESGIPAQTLRGAYRRALLQNHPDKSIKAAATLSSKQSTYSIDQISEAFSILSNLTSRKKYDKELKLQNSTTNVGGVKGRQVFHTGVETVDLDDLEVGKAQGIWYRSCRCGDSRGFLIGEADLEEAADEGEISVGCRGCSLWLKVLFGVIKEEVHDETGSTKHHEAT